MKDGFVEPFATGPDGPWARSPDVTRRVQRCPRGMRAKLWCCMYDAATGRLVGRTTDPSAIWSAAEDGAILHPAEVVDRLVAWSLLRQVAAGRWAAD